jgi:hypothetical protein
VPNCKSKEYFENKHKYKKHLEFDHSRFLCDLCVENSVLLLDEQKIYRKHEIRAHLEKGEFDKEGNLLSLHPKCLYCEKHFFNDDALLLHMKKQHEKCHLCRKKKYKYNYYNDYFELERHFE